MHLINRIKTVSLLVIATLISACSSTKDHGVTRGHVIILNGQPSAEKSQIITSFISKNDQAWLTITIPENVVHGAQQVHRSTDKIKGLHLTVASLAQKGSNVIVDYMTHDPSLVTHLQKTLSNIPTFVVGIKTSAAREDIAHRGWRYNLEINQSITTTEQAVALIMQYIKFRRGISEIEHVSQQSGFLGTTVKK